ncbi:hypothetical protein D043_4114, partial [Vibrio parahaemolyticus EKP-021]
LTYVNRKVNRFSAVANRFGCGCRSFRTHVRNFCHIGCSFRGNICHFLRNFAGTFRGKFRDTTSRRATKGHDCTDDSDSNF